MGLTRSDNRHGFGVGVLCVALGASFCVGCGDNGMSQVTGVVTLDGAPLTTGRVQFFPTEGYPSKGDIQPDGSYELSTKEPGDGVKPGEYRVTVEAVEVSTTGSPPKSLMDELQGGGSDYRAESRSLVPPIYSQTISTPLTETVAEGQNTIDIKLQSK